MIAHAERKPEPARTQYRSAQELRDNGLQHPHDAMALAESRSDDWELDGYRHFVFALAHMVAAAHILIRREFSNA